VHDALFQLGQGQGTLTALRQKLNDKLGEGQANFPETLVLVDLFRLGGVVLESGFEFFLNVAHTISSSGFFMTEVS